VVIAIQKVQRYGISTGVKNLWKEIDSPKASRLGVLARAGTNVLLPLWFRAAQSDLQDQVSPFQTGWILAHCLGWSKRKVCEARYQRSHGIHNFSTSTENGQVSKKCTENKGI
jgi:hypothetical protein